ncbi:TRAP transporter large permease [Vreelandella neptunia]|jgi:TRAP-type transport system large permease protein|uniref:TRAP transporter large permease protein n=1 Tax=Vreelandella neptunia TaxID=115551 RepID=A0ABZ0YKS7_9GAMM|nr:MULTISPECIES: TRAP transporter large permease [Halomonas]MBL1267567.1 TRAP transporter large permease [Halomonas sp.]MDN3560354.1 TRAP transporter large permease [Halomonas neptunia]WQH12721.1 TRAP transporter large permease [Halomonas neptunia]
MTFMAFLVFMLLGMPIAFVLLGSTLTFVLASGNYRLLESLPQVIFSSLDVLDLLAIPLFILLGEVMNEGGITRRIITAARAWFAWIPHSIAYVSLTSNLMLASIMGSATAQIAIMSRVMTPEMERDGYDRGFAAALTAGAGLLGPIIPPSMVFIIYGVIAQVSIGAMFMGGVLPGLLLFVLISGLIAIIARRAHNSPTGERDSIPLWRATRSALFTLSIPAVIVGGIAFGVVTPTESAATATLMAVIIGSVFFRELKWGQLPGVLSRTARNTAIVLFLIAAAKAFGWVLVYNQIPQQVAELLQNTTESPLVFMLLVFVMLILVGMVLDGIAALIILVPILLPVAQQSYDIDPIHFGIVTCMTLSLGLLTPPVGAGLYVASAISNVSLPRITKWIFPFIVATCLVILAVIFNPWVVNLLS